MSRLSQAQLESDFANSGFPNKGSWGPGNTDQPSAIFLSYLAASGNREFTSMRDFVRRFQSPGQIYAVSGVQIDKSRIIEVAVVETMTLGTFGATSFDVQRAVKDLRDAGFNVDSRIVGAGDGGVSDQQQQQQQQQARDQAVLDRLRGNGDDDLVAPPKAIDDVTDSVRQGSPSDGFEVGTVLLVGAGLAAAVIIGIFVLE